MTTQAAASPFHCVVSADLFRRAMSAISTEETRYYLGGVFVQPCARGGAILTSTNGHWLINIRDPRGIVEGCGIVKISKLLTAQLKPNRTDCLSKYGHAAERVLVAGHAGDIREARASVVLSGLVHTPKGGHEPIEPRPEALDALWTPDRSVVAAQFSDAMIDGVFPDWTRIVPDQPNFDAPIPALDQSYVSAAAKALSEERSRTPIRLGAVDQTSPVMIVSPTQKLGDWDGFAVVMPIRSPAASAPSYWKPEPLAEAA